MTGFFELAACFQTLLKTIISVILSTVHHVVTTIDSLISDKITE